MKTEIQNPVLCGFNPDPCILRVGDTYYIATSTFEYYPGVQISASKDLVNWKVVAHPINKDKLDLIGVPQGGGVWAPCLSHDGQKFYLVYSKVTIWSKGPFKDVENYIITADTVEGKWSDPIRLNADGFDASLYHDDDGTKYYMSVRWDYRKDEVGQFSGIILTKLDPETLQPTEPYVKIFAGSDYGKVEAPHIYKHDGYYYLFTAEGGTNVEHAQTVARSKNIYGPYELHPMKHMITSYRTDCYLQKAGHGSMVEDGQGNWYYAHLCGRKQVKDNCVLGRETAIQNMIWKDGWPMLANGTNHPSDTFTVPYAVQKEKAEEQIPFNTYTLENIFQSVRVPMDGKYQILSPNRIRIQGGESVCSAHNQNLLAVRQQHFAFHAQVDVDFTPELFSHLAGLIYRYNEENLYLLYISRDDVTGKRCLLMMSMIQNSFRMSEPLAYFDETEQVTLGLDVRFDKGRFTYTVGGKTESCGYEIEPAYLSDEGACPMGFTGAFVGMYVGDFANHRHTADFSNFIYRPIE